MSHVAYRTRPELSRPVMICAFSGWNDGGEAATTAARTLRSQWGARRFAEMKGTGSLLTLPHARELAIAQVILTRE